MKLFTLKIERCEPKPKVREGVSNNFESFKITGIVKYVLLENNESEMIQIHMTDNIYIRSWSFCALIFFEELSSHDKKKKKVIFVKIPTVNVSFYLIF